MKTKTQQLITASPIGGKENMAEGKSVENKIIHNVGSVANESYKIVGETNMKRTLIFLVLLSIVGIHTQAQVTKVGTTAASFLGIDVGPRGTAMGGAYVAVVNDVTAMYWNPSGIAKIDNFQATFSNTKWIADLSFNYAGAVVALEEFGNIGVNATFLSMDEMERTTLQDPDGTGEFFDAGMYAVGVSYARNLTDQFSIGFNAKYINETAYHSSAQGFALDIGTMFDTQFEGLRLGMSISNYGTKMQMDGRDMYTQVDPDKGLAGNNPNINANLRTDQFDLPLTFRVGVAIDALKGLANSNLILSVDALHPSNDVESVNIGGEYVFNNMISLRAGYRDLFVEDSQRGLNLGAGIKYNIEGATMFHFDYSFVDFGILNSVHMFSVTLGI